LLTQVEALYSDIWTSDLNEDLKKIVLENLQKIKTAVNDYRIRGADRLQDALATVIGTFAMVGPIDAADVSDGSKALQRFSKVVDLLMKIVTLAKATKPLLKAGLEAFHRYLLSSGS
jgi:hypothetical protein